MNIKQTIRFALLLIAMAHMQTTALINNDCCETCNYLLPCAWSLEVHGGVNPIQWLNRNDSCCIDGAFLPKFRSLFKIPWIVGGKVGYNLTECTEIYIEGDYTQAKGKTCNGQTIVCPQSVNGTSILNSQVNKYKAFGIWGGARYYWGFDCFNQCSCLERAAFFIGMQVGFVHHRRIDVTLALTNPLGDTPAFTNTIFLKSNVISAGGNFGFDLAVNNCFSLVFTVAVLGNGATKNCPVICLDTPLPGINASTIVVGRFGTELWIPITLGLKYTF
jgi:hypothetical protein